MHDLNSKGIYSIKDLKEYNWHNFAKTLSNEWKNILFADYELLQETNRSDKYTNPIMWKNLNYSKFKYHRSKLLEIYSEKKTNKRNEITSLIESKCLELIKTS